MAHFSSLLFLLSISTFITSSLSSLYNPPPQPLTYHNGPLLDGDIPISILWYGNFAPSQKSIIVDFILSLTFPHNLAHLSLDSAPQVSKWWQTVDDYLRKAGKKQTHVHVSMQVSDPGCSLGKYLTRSQLAMLAATKLRNQKDGGLALILTAEDVTVESFCMAACGLHSSYGRRAYVWVGNSAAQCPGQCAWPFHEPVYGPHGGVLGPPNGDVGVDGMVINLGTLLAGAVTNPFGSGFYVGDVGAPMEVAGACAGVYGAGAYPGYAGRVRVDGKSGGSYNVVGLSGRKHLVPALLGPETFTCSLVV